MTAAMNDFRPQDRRALEITEKIVDQVQPHQLDLPTPCGEWTLRQLLAHMIGQNHGFADAADGKRTELTDWADRDFGDDPAGVFRASSTRVADAFAQEGVLEREFWLPEVRGGMSFPAPVAIGFHFVDYVVHGWDVAAAIGVPARFEQDLLRAVLPIALAVPDGPARQTPGSSFRPGLPTSSEDLLDQVLATLGRSSSWPA
ncbi:TIGR03086 family metal-binding protein [Streptacidiphilus sp. P02-A3a]|uniref:TIGR03086 family metal-binding protein n=1 Tax=Streptacidiphilus sp. P02-A3a TaxID=2704468 RepID=UPI0015F88176|nr:TIGR03086 family metal-binding protein [Streptacidiphilus sp. P02-A3a]QMU67141.1 TIGR03086 family protein [Streptacidiphilus sp. P02-A3a]